MIFAEGLRGDPTDDRSHLNARTLSAKRNSAKVGQERGQKNYRQTEGLLNDRSSLQGRDRGRDSSSAAVGIDAKNYSRDKSYHRRTDYQHGNERRCCSHERVDIARKLYNCA